MIVSVRADLGDGNDPLEETVDFMVVPRVGDTLEVWIDAADKGGFGGHPEFFEVKDVVISTYWTDRIEVWVSTDGVPDTHLIRAFQAIRNKEVP